FFFVTTFSGELIPYTMIYPLPFKLKKEGDNKLFVDIRWSGIDEPEDERLKCFSHAVTIDGPYEKHGKFGDRKTQYELIIHRKNVQVKCQFRVTDISSFVVSFVFRT
ncbi:40953_t:CDS:2, partial [Gigaspora margarita]